MDMRKQYPSLLKLLEETHWGNTKDEITTKPVQWIIRRLANSFKRKSQKG